MVDPGIGALDAGDCTLTIWPLFCRIIFGRNTRVTKVAANKGASNVDQISPTVISNKDLHWPDPAQLTIMSGVPEDK